jgi:hypothetical protein
MQLLCSPNLGPNYQKNWKQGDVQLGGDPLDSVAPLTSNEKEYPAGKNPYNDVQVMYQNKTWSNPFGNIDGANDNFSSPLKMKLYNGLMNKLCEMGIGAVYRQTIKEEHQEREYFKYEKKPFHDPYHKYGIVDQANCYR